MMHVIPERVCWLFGMEKRKETLFSLIQTDFSSLVTTKKQFMLSSQILTHSSEIMTIFSAVQAVIIRATQRRLDRQNKRMNHLNSETSEQKQDLKDETPQQSK
jgi:hypothetical protein